MTFPATRTDALARLEIFLPRAGRAYAANRNSDAGPGTEDSTSRLSPAIRRRLISEAEVCARVIGAHGFAAAEKFIQEVCWRTYWVGWLEQRPAVWTRYAADVERLTAQDHPGLADALAGRTGIDCFDAWIAELAATGWLHNHARMNFASIWIFTLRLPWQLGADLFYRHLLDACPASNTLSWRWVAGLQTVGKTYAARADIIRDRSGGRFAVTAPLARSADPLPADVIPPPKGLRTTGHADPALRTGLFVTTADLSPETLPLPPLVAVSATTRIGGAPTPLKRAHAETALADGLGRAAVHVGCAAERIDEADAITAIRDWAARHRLQQLVTAEAPVGPVADRLAAMAAALAEDGVRLVQLRRAWDASAWPLATKGFFGFKAAIPQLLTLSS
ncbi:MAG: FAD-binding domain-containing protein [Polymorphobacter sp.]